MSLVNTNYTEFQYAEEQSFGVLPGSPSWKKISPNTVTSWGATITTVARRPISPQRAARKGVVTDLDATAAFDHDTTMSLMEDMMPYFLFGKYKGTAPFVPTAATVSGFTVSSGGALAEGRLVFMRGAVNAANNGLFVVGSGSTATNIAVTGLTAETFPANVLLEVAGVRGATGDLQIDADGNLISTALDFTTLGLTVGQYIKIGGEATITKFATAGNNHFARVDVIAANKLTLNKRNGVFSADTGTGKTIDVLFGRFARDVSAFDADFQEVSLTWEAAFKDLGGAGVPKYGYVSGSYCNEIGLNLPLTDKSTCSVAFVSKDAPEPTTTRATNAASGKAPLKEAAVSTAIDIARLKFAGVDETGYGSCFKSVSVTINNGITPDKCIGTLGASLQNVGFFTVTMQAELELEDSAIIGAIRNNVTGTFAAAVRSTDGGFMLELPAMTLGDGALSLPQNEKVRISVSGDVFLSTSELGYSVGFSTFPYLPASLSGINN